MHRMKFFVFCGALLLSGAGPALAKSAPKPSPADLAGPWNSPDAVIVLDPFHKNDYEIADLKLDPKIVAIIHKATEGANIADSKYEHRKKEALEAGFLWGSYHLGRPGDPIGQATRYLDKIRPGPNEVVALDLEQEGGSMSMAEAAQFVREVHKRLGRYPLLYGGRLTVSRPLTNADKEVLRHCPLWLVSTITPRRWPKDIWPAYTLWQFSSELRYRYPLAKASMSSNPVSWDIDVNYYPGTRQQLQAAWPLGKE